MKTKPKLITLHTKRKEALHSAVYREYTELMAQPGAQQAAVFQIIMKKRKIYSRTTMYKIIKQFKSQNQN